MPSLIETSARTTKKVYRLDRQKILEFVGIGVHVPTKTHKSKPLLFYAKYWDDGAPVCKPEVIALSGELVPRHLVDSYAWLLASLLVLPFYSGQINCGFIEGKKDEFKKRLERARIRVTNKANYMETPFKVVKLQDLDFDFLKQNAMKMSGEGVQRIDSFF